MCSESEEERLEKAQSNQKEHLGVVAIKPYQFKMSEIEGFRYRAKVHHYNKVDNNSIQEFIVSVGCIVSCYKDGRFSHNISCSD